MRNQVHHQNSRNLFPSGDVDVLEISGINAVTIPFHVVPSHPAMQSFRNRVERSTEEYTISKPITTRIKTPSPGDVQSWLL